MGIIKLQKVGDALTMTVTDCEQVKGNFGEQVKFTAETGDILFLPKDSADRQLERLGLTYVTCPGETLTFSRDPNKKPGAQPYWSIAVASRGAASAPASKRVSAADADPYVGVPALPDFPRSQGKAPQRVPVPQRSAPSHGGPLPGEELPEDVEDWMTAPVPESPDGFEAFSAAVDAIAQPAPTPRETADAMLKAKKRHEFVGFYAALFAALKESLPDGTSDEATQSATATCVIHFGKVGLLP